MPVSGLDESEPERARIGDAKFAWIEEGAAGATNPPLVLIHGFTGHRDDFIGVLPELARKRRVIAPDLRGHGNFDLVSDSYGWTFDQLVKDLIALLDHLEIERCDLFGHSMGGMLTLRFALAHPERIRSLLFMCTAPELPATIGRRAFEIGADIADARGMDGLQELMEKVGREDSSDTISRWGERYWLHHRRRLRSMTPDSFRGIGTAFFGSESLVDRLAEIKAPTLVIVGESDGDFLSGADLFEKNLPNVKRITLADAEHHPHQENPKAWHTEIEAHLDDMQRAATPLAENANEGNER